MFLVSMHVRSQVRLETSDKGQDRRVGVDASAGR